MLAFLRDLIAHAEWANAVFFHTWGKTPARDHEELRTRVDHFLRAQEAFLSLWRKLDDYDAARGELRGWLLRIVHNGAIDRLRRSRMQESRRASDEGIEDRLEAPERTDLEVEQREQAQEVRTALEALPSEQRRVIELAYFDGLTHTQIASLLDTPVGTVKGRMRLGLTKLGAQLGPEREAAPEQGRVAV